MHNRLGDLWLGDWWHHPSDPSLFSPKVHHPISKAFLKPRSEIPSFAASKPKLELEGAQILSSQRRSQLYGGFLCTWFNPKLGSTSLGTGRSPTLFSSAHPQTHPNGVVTQIARYHQILGIWWVVSKYPSLEPQDTQSQGTYVCGQMMSVDVRFTAPFLLKLGELFQDPAPVAPVAGSAGSAGSTTGSGASAGCTRSGGSKGSNTWQRGGSC